MIELAKGIRQVKPGLSMRMSPGRWPRKGTFDSSHSKPPSKTSTPPATTKNLPMVSNPFMATSSLLS